MSKVRLDLETLETQNVEDILRKQIEQRNGLIDMLLRDMATMSNGRSVPYKKNYNDIDHMDQWILECQQRCTELMDLVCREIGHKGVRGKDPYCIRCGTTLHV